MIESRLRLIPLSDITIPPSRQRTEMSAASVFDLACAIAQQGLLQDPGLDADTMTLIWGGTRYAAFCLMRDVAADEETERTAQYTNEELAQLRALLASATKHYDQWTKLPVKFYKGASRTMLEVLELSENFTRTDLSWQDKAAAVETIHKLAVAEASARRENWYDIDTAKLIGCSREWVKDLLSPARKLAAITDPKVKALAESAAKESRTAISAANAIDTVASRHGVSTKPNLATTLGLGATKPAATVRPVAETTPTSTAPPPATSPLSLGARSILCADFHEWAANYDGEPFNFIHCDFPYGIDFNKAGGQQTSAATHSVGKYDDNENVYWALLDTLLANRSKLLAPSAHILFWFSQNKRRETEDKIMESWPDAKISKFLLIWHTNNSGLLPTPAEGRRTYETALQICLGNRPLVQSKAMSFVADRGGNKIHRSEKPIEVLSHFLSMYVDSSSRVLDPTAGSGTSIIASARLKAKQVLGLEIDPEMHQLAVNHIDRAFS